MATNAQILVKARIGTIPGIAWIIGLAGILRFVNLGQENLWYDESFTLLLARLPLGNLLTAIRGDVHPPLWYFVEAVNIRLFGTSEIALRWPSALLGCLAVWQIYRLSLRLGLAERIAKTAGLFCAILPAMLYYSQEARMYMLLTCAVLWMIQSALDERWYQFELAGIIAAYSQNLGLAYVACIGLATLILSRRRLPAFIALGCIGIAWLPWAVWGLSHQIANMSQGFWMAPLTLGGALWPLTSVTMGWRLGDQLQLHIYATSVALSLWGLYRSWGWLRSKAGLIYLAGLLGMPLVLALVSVLWRDIYLHRALLPSAALLMIPWAYGLDSLGKANRRVALVVVAPALAIGVLAHYFPTHSRSDIASWVQPVNQEWRQGDIAYHVAIDSCILSQSYLKHPYYLLPESSDLSQSLTDETKHAVGFPMAPFDSLLTQGYQRAYFFWIDSPMVSQKELNEIARIKDHYWYKVIQESRGQIVGSGIWLVDLNSKDVF